MSRRRFDLLVAFSSLLLLSPILLLIALLIRLEDGGPVLFTQTRLGRDRRDFRIYKFRSMRDGCVTRIGRRLRATGFDELPQLVNVLRGDMTLIGPRPLTRADVVRLAWNDEAHALRWRMKPGIVGLAQLYAGRGARLSWFLDAFYVRQRRMSLDAAILSASAAVGIVGKHRVRSWLRRRRRKAAAAQRKVSARAEWMRTGSARAWVGASAIAVSGAAASAPDHRNCRTNHLVYTRS